MPARATRRAAHLPLAMLVALLALVPAVTACGDVTIAPEATPVAGVADVTSVDRQLEPFTRISVGAAITLVVSPSPETKVTVEAPGDMMDAIRTEVVDGQLVVTIPPPGVVSTKKIKLTVKAPDIESLAIAAGATATLQTDRDTLHLDVSGSSSLAATGTVGELSLVETAAGRVDFTALKVTNMTVRLSDGSAATLAVSGTLGGKLDGGSHIQLVEQPAQVTAEAISGSTISGP